MKLNRSLEAFLRGYFVFDVSGITFYLYNSAIAERDRMVNDIEFTGWHLVKGWQCFFLRVAGETTMPDPCPLSLDANEPHHPASSRKSKA